MNKIVAFKCHGKEYLIIHLRNFLIALPKDRAKT